MTMTAYFLLNKEKSEPFQLIAERQINAEQEAIKFIKENIVCDDVFSSKGRGATRFYCAFKDSPDFEKWGKKPLQRHAGLNIHSPRVRTEEGKVLTQAESTCNAVVNFHDYCNEYFKDFNRSVMGSSGSSFCISSTGFALYDDQVIVCMPFSKTSELDSLVLPEGMTQITEIEFAKLKEGAEQWRK